MEKLAYLQYQAKCHFDENVKIIFCVAICMRMSLRAYWNLNFSSKILLLQWLLGPSLLLYCGQKVKWYTFPKKFCLIIFLKNTIHILDMSCRHKHQQQRYHNENMTICMFIYYIYVDIRFLLTKAIPIMFEPVTMHNCYHNLNALERKKLPYRLVISLFVRFHKSFHSLLWNLLDL